MSLLLRYASVLVLLIITYLIGSIHYLQQDSASFLEALRILDGQDGLDRLMRLNKPISLILPFFFFQLGISAPIAFMLQSVFSICLCIYFLSRIIQHQLINTDQKAHSKESTFLLSTWIILGCQCTAVYGFAVLTDSLSWAIILGGIYYVLRLKSIQLKQQLMIGLLVGLGFFVKESCLLLLVFTSFFLFFIKTPWIRLIRSVLLISSTAFFIISSISLLQDIYLGYSFFDWLSFNKTDSPHISITNTIKQLFRTLDFYWLLLIYLIILFRKTIQQHPAHLALLLSSLVCVIMMPIVWDYHFDRIQFVGVLPLLPLLGIYGGKLANYPYVFIIIAILNLLNTFLIYSYQYSLLYIGFIFVAALLISHYTITHKKSPN